jgi:hypothetical protein
MSACEHFTVDTAASVFGTCTCGFAKGAHTDKAIGSALAARPRGVTNVAKIAATKKTINMAPPSGKKKNVYGTMKKTFRSGWAPTVVHRKPGQHEFQGFGGGVSEASSGVTASGNVLGEWKPKEAAKPEEPAGRILLDGDGNSMSQASSSGCASVVYDANNSPIYLTGGSSGQFDTMYDESGDVVEIYDENGAQIFTGASSGAHLTVYDASGQPIVLSGGSSGEATTVYDHDGNAILLVANSGGSFDTVYDASGQAIDLFDENGSKIMTASAGGGYKTVYDSNGQPLPTSSSSGDSVTLYDHDGNPILLAASGGAYCDLPLCDVHCSYLLHLARTLYHN